MRSIFWISLALAAGCGDNMGESTDFPESGDQTVGVQDDGLAPRLIPEICAARAWPEAFADSKDMDLAVVPMTQGAAVLSVSKQGGPLYGFLVDSRGLIMGNPAGTKIRTDGVYTGVSAAVVDSRLVVGLVEGTNISVNVIRDDLGDYRELADVTCSFVGDATVMHSRGERVTTTGGNTGMVLSTFDSAWSPMSSEVIARSVPTSMTSVAYGNDAMLAWSTASTCHLGRVAAGVYSEQNFACSNGRLAVDYASRAGFLVYERGGAIMISDIRASAHNEIANENLLVPSGTSPRIAFDGHRYWVSYLNSRGDVIIGYLDEDNSLNSMAIEFNRPASDAYDLAFVNGAIEVYAYDGDTGYNAHRICLVAE
jgi:hypothetical protein